MAILAPQVAILAPQVAILAPRTTTASRTQAGRTRPRVDRLRRAPMPGRPDRDRARRGRPDRDPQAEADHDLPQTARPGPLSPTTVVRRRRGRRASDPASGTARSIGLPSRPIGRSRAALRSVLAGLPAGAPDRSTAGLAAAGVPLVPASRAADP